MLFILKIVISINNLIPSDYWFTIYCFFKEMYLIASIKNIKSLFIQDDIMMAILLLLANSKYCIMTYIQYPNTLLLKLLPI